MRPYKKKGKNIKPLIEPSSGNVFIDLGFPEHEAVNIVARLELMLRIEKIIKAHGWTQQRAAKFLGLSQGRISELMTSRSEKFTVDMLMKLLDRLDHRVEFTVKAKRKAA